MSDAGAPLDARKLESLLHDVPLELTVELGRIRLTLSELAARLGPGSVITLDKERLPFKLCFQSFNDRSLNPPFNMPN